MQKHTVTHFDGSKADEILREKLLKQTMRKKKKKKKQGKVLLPMEIGMKQKFKKSYSCLLCDSEFIKKASWRIHKIRHNGKGWKCQFCNDLFETSEILRNHLIDIHKMNSEEMEMLGILKTANMFVVTKKLKTSIKKSDSSSEESDTDSEDPDDDDEDEMDFEDDEDEEGKNLSFFLKLIIVIISLCYFLKSLHQLLLSSI